MENILIISSDIPVPKKPAPDLYLYAAEKLGLNVGKAFVLEDSEVGLQAALAAEVAGTLITTSTFTSHENFNGASLVVDDLSTIMTPRDNMSSSSILDFLGTLV